MRNRSIAAYVVLGLIAIGIIVSIRFLLVPLIIFGIIFLLYKFPPDRWRLPWKSSSTWRNNTASRSKHRKGKFRVIQGNKDSSDDPPKYH